MKTSKVGLTLLLVCCVWAVFIVAGCTKDEVDTTGTIYGIVNDADNGEPVSGVYIVLNPGGKTANTGSDGRFEFLDMEPGQYTIQISKNGYKTIRNAFPLLQESRLPAIWCWNGVSRVSS